MVGAAAVVGAADVGAAGAADVGAAVVGVGADGVGAGADAAVDVAAAVVALSEGNSTKESHSSSVVHTDADSISESVTSLPVTLAKTSLTWVTSAWTCTIACETEAVTDCMAFFSVSVQVKVTLITV